MSVRAYLGTCLQKLVFVFNTQQSVRRQEKEMQLSTQKGKVKVSTDYSSEQGARQRGRESEENRNVKRATSGFCSFKNSPRNESTLFWRGEGGVKKLTKISFIHSIYP